MLKILDKQKKLNHIVQITGFRRTRTIVCKTKGEDYSNETSIFHRGLALHDFNQYKLQYFVF